MCHHAHSLLYLGWNVRVRSLSVTNTLARSLARQLTHKRTQLYYMLVHKHLTSTSADADKPARRTSPFISETVRDRPMITMER